MYRIQHYWFYFFLVMFLKWLTVFWNLSVKHLGLVPLEGQGCGPSSATWEMPRYQPSALHGEMLLGSTKTLIRNLVLRWSRRKTDQFFSLSPAWGWSNWIIGPAVTHSSRRLFLFNGCLMFICAWTATMVAASFICGWTLAISRPTEWALLDILK